MLRSLDLHRTDENGEYMLDPDGNKYAVTPGSEQPKRRELMSADEIEYIEVKARDTEEEHQIRVARYALEREALLKAATSLAGKEV
jgi:hypothetical protein